MYIIVYGGLHSQTHLLDYIFLGQMNQRIHPIFCQATEKSTSPSQKISIKVVPVVKALLDFSVVKFKMQSNDVQDIIKLACVVTTRRNSDHFQVVKSC